MLSPSATMDLLGTAVISFSPPSNDGGDNISHYTVTATPGDLHMIVMPQDIKHASFVDLTPGVFYRFSVSATNSQGTSVQSVENGELRAHTLPASPIITSIVRTGPTTARIYFDPSLFNGGAEVSRCSLFMHVNGSGAVPINSTLFAPGILDVFDLPSSSSLVFSMTASSVAGSSLQSINSETITTPASPVVSPSQPPSTEVPVSVAPVNTIISSPSIGGVIAPVAGATPVTTITETAQYTGTVSWSGLPSTFASATIYTATITLIAKSGFTLTGVATDFYTVAGSTSDTNTASSGVVTAVFPATASSYSISSVTAAPTSGSATFGYGSAVSATLTLTRAGDSGFAPTTTLTVTGGSWTVTSGSGVTTSSASLSSGSPVTLTLNAASGTITLALATGANAGSYTATTNNTPTPLSYVVTIVKANITTIAIPGIVDPVQNATPVTTTTVIPEYSGTVSWNGTFSNGKFKVNTIYTATITLTAGLNYRFPSPELIFTVNGIATTKTYSETTVILTVTFPTT